MNICFYTDFTLSGMTGGIGRATTVLTNFFRQHYGWRVYSIYAFEAKDDCIRTPNDGAIRLRLHDRLGFRRLNENYRRAAQFIHDNQIQIVIIQTSLDVVAKLQNVLAQQGIDDVKVISVLHYSPGTDEFPIITQGFWKNLCRGKLSVKDLAKSLIAPLYNWWEHHATVKAYRYAYHSGDAVVLLSQSYIPEYLKFASLSESSKLYAIPNCVPFEYTMTQEEIDQKQQSALVVGRMVDFPKRISLILRMWKEIEAQRQDWTLEIVGDGPDLEAFKQQAQSLGLQRCTFFGRQDPIDFYRRASLFFMASEFEGFPMTLVEAQQMGCIPIAFDSFGSLGEVISDGANGRTVDNGDTTSYIHTVLELMDDRESRRHLMLGAIRDCQAFSQAAICTQWKSLLEQIIA